MVALEICLPAEKLEHLRTELGKWRGKKHAERGIFSLYLGFCLMPERQ